MIYKVDVQTGDAVLIAEMDRDLRLRDGPVWAKDGKRFFYRAGIRSEEKRYVYTYDLKTGKNDRFLTVHPDGQRVAFMSTGEKLPQSQVWVMENFLPVDKAKKWAAQAKKWSGFIVTFSP